MDQISGFAAEDPPAAELYRAAARFFERMAADVSSGGAETASLEAFFHLPSAGAPR